MVLLAVLTNPILGMFDVRSPIGHKPDGGMLSVALLFRLIVIRRRVRRRPSLKRKRNKQCYYGWLYLSTDSSKLTPIRDGAALLKPSPRWVNAPAPLSLHHSSPQRSLLRSVLESLCSCSSCLFLSRVFNQIASTTNLLSLPYST